MFNSLKSKFIVSFVVLELLFFTIIVGINFNSLDKASQTLTNEKIQATSQLLVELLKTPLIVSDLATIDDIAKNFLTIKNTVAIQVKNINHVQLSTYVKKDTIPLALFNKMILENDTTTIYIAQKYLLTSVKVKVENKEIGQIHFVFNTTHNLEHLQKNKNLSYSMIFIALIISFIVSYIIGNNLEKLLNFLTKIAQDVANGKKVNIPYDTTNKNEMGKLFHSMHIMQKLISERTEKLNKSIARFGENVIASSSDTKGKITYASEALCTISGYTEDELLGQPHSILRHPDTPSKVFKEMWETLKLGHTWSGELKNRNKNGRYYWVSASISPEFNHNHEIIGYTSIRHDISAQKVKEEFMANMSHELRTPLNAIIGFSSILSKKLENSEYSSSLEHISSSSKSLLTLINDILDLSKIQNSKFTIDAYAFNAYDEILRHTENFEGLTSQKNITLKVMISDNLKVLLFGDWHRISQVLLNIISNSIKFTPKIGQIIFKADYINNSLILSVSDNGIGMSKDVQNKIFQPFEQADGSTTRKYGGTGLGLSITQNLIELMKGKIELESKENEGTTFKITIPLEKAEDNKLENNKIHMPEQYKENSLSGHILIVEDNHTNQMLIKLILENFGLTSDIANDGIEAVDMYNPEIHDLILMDENMPNMNGLEAMKIIQDKYQDKCGAIIALTANSMKGDKEKFLALGMDGYVAKPIDENKLYQVLKGLL